MVLPTVAGVVVVVGVPTQLTFSKLSPTDIPISQHDPNSPSFRLPSRVALEQWLSPNAIPHEVIPQP